MAAGRNDSRSDPAIVGRTVPFNNHPFTVIGVAPKGFIGTEVAYAPEFWAPLMMAKQIEPGSTWLEHRDSDNLFVIGRLKPGVTAAQAEAPNCEAHHGEMAKEHPTENAGRGIALDDAGLVHSRHPRIPSSRFTGVLAVVGALVLLLACVNLANLLLARATERRKEIAHPSRRRREPRAAR